MRFLSVGLLLVSMLFSRGATHNVGGFTRADILAAIALCSDGDTVFFPAGTYPITATITNIPALTFQGAGTNDTILLDAIPARSSANYNGVFWFKPINTNVITRLTQMKIKNDGTNNLVAFTGIIKLTSASTLFVVDHVTFENIKARPGYFFNNSTNGNWGFVYSYVAFNGLPGHGFFMDANSNNGYYGWGTPIQWGTTNGWGYFENCFASNSTATAWMDGRCAMMITARSNVFVNVSVQNHELDHRKLGPLALESYGNTFLGVSSDAHFIRGGTATITGNDVAMTMDRLIGMVNYRSLQHAGSGSGASWGLFGPANGTNIWDFNFPGPLGLSTNVTGTVGGAPTNATNQLIVDTNQFWTPDDKWKGVTAIDTTTGKGGLISGSTSNTITLYAGLGTSTNDIMYVTNGHTYMITQVDKAFEQPGAGPGDMLCCGGDTVQAKPTGWPHETTDPIYIWNNTGKTNISTDIYSLIIRAGRNWTNVARPGWVPLVYPHPLISIVNGIPPVIPPTITTITNQTIAVSTSTSVLPITIGAGQTNVANYVMSYTSSSTNLVPASGTNVVFAGSGANRTVRIWPRTAQSGSTTIAIFVTDENGIQASTIFDLMVADSNTPPNITPIDNQNISPSSSTSALPFMVDDFESNATNLVVTRLSSNTNIILTANVVLAGTSTNRSVAVTSGTNVGFSTITLTVTDPGGKTNYTQFLVTVSPPAPSAPLFRGAYRRRPF